MEAKSNGRLFPFKKQFCKWLIYWIGLGLTIIRQQIAVKYCQNRLINPQPGFSDQCMCNPKIKRLTIKVMNILMGKILIFKFAIILYLTLKSWKRN